MRKLLRFAAASAMALSLTTGVAAANTIDVETPGPGSDATVDVRHDSNREVNTETNLDFENNNPQTAVSGDVNAERNTEADDVSSGAARADSLTRANLTVNNSGAAAVANGGNGNGDVDISVSTPGPDSNAEVDVRSNHNVEMNTETNISFVNNNSQTAVSGSVNAERNTDVGNVHSGGATAVSTTELTVNVSN